MPARSHTDKHKLRFSGPMGKYDSNRSFVIDCFLVEILARCMSGIYRGGIHANPPFGNARGSCASRQSEERLGRTVALLQSRNSCSSRHLSIIMAASGAIPTTGRQNERRRRRCHRTSAASRSWHTRSCPSQRCGHWDAGTGADDRSWACSWAPLARNTAMRTRSANSNPHVRTVRFE